MKKSWRERLANDRAQAQIKPIPPRMQKKSGEGTIVIPTLREVDDTIRRIPRGKLATIESLSDSLARKHRTNIGCTVTTGIFAWMTANAACEAEREGVKRVAPYWRVLKVGGELNPKYPGGISALRARLESEGHTLLQDGARVRVEDYSTKLARL